MPHACVTDGHSAAMIAAGAPRDKPIRGGRRLSLRIQFGRSPDRGAQRGRHRVPVGKGVSIAPIIKFNFKAMTLKASGLTITWRF